LHHTVMENDMMRMQELEDGIRIKAGATVELSPGGMHIMVMGLQKPLNKDDSIEITLHFEDGSQLIQNFPILDKRN
jgi:copper(I)-binding protein